MKNFFFLSLEEGRLFISGVGRSVGRSVVEEYRQRHTGSVAV